MYHDHEDIENISHACSVRSENSVHALKIHTFVALLSTDAPSHSATGDEQTDTASSLCARCLYSDEPQTSELCAASHAPSSRTSGAHNMPARLLQFCSRSQAPPGATGAARLSSRILLSLSTPSVCSRNENMIMVRMSGPIMRSNVRAATRDNCAAR